MRTTIDIPDDLFRKVKVKAAEEGLRLKDVVADLIERGLENPGPNISGPRKSPPPVFREATGRSIRISTNAEANQILDEEDVQRYLKSFD